MIVDSLNKLFKLKNNDNGTMREFSVPNIQKITKIVCCNVTITFFL